MQDAGEGIIVFVSSQAALIGIYGLAAYCGSKYAVRGFAEALAMEVRPHGIGVTVCCPPDTDTPGFEEEQKSKGPFTYDIRKISGFLIPSLSLVHISCNLSVPFVRKIGQFLNPLPPSVRTS